MIMEKYRTVTLSSIFARRKQCQLQLESNSLKGATNSSRIKKLYEPPVRQNEKEVVKDGSPSSVQLLEPYYCSSVTKRIEPELCRGDVENEPKAVIHTTSSPAVKPCSVVLQRLSDDVGIRLYDEGNHNFALSVIRAPSSDICREEITIDQSDDEDVIDLAASSPSPEPQQEHFDEPEIVIQPPEDQWIPAENDPLSFLASPNSLSRFANLINSSQPNLKSVAQVVNPCDTPNVTTAPGVVPWCSFLQTLERGEPSPITTACSVQFPSTLTLTPAVSKFDCKSPEDPLEVVPSISCFEASVYHEPREPGFSRCQSSSKLHKKGDRPFICHSCPKSFSKRWHLIKHLRTHSDQRPWQCEICKRCFKHSYDCKRHMIRAHTKDYPHKCSVCRKGFITPKLVRIHEEKCH